MKVLAQTIVDALLWLQLSPEETIPPDAADEAMDVIAAGLQECSPEEREAVLEVVREQYRIQNEAGADEEVIDFFENFEESFLAEDEVE